MYECQECGNISQTDYKCCELCGCDEWIKNKNYQEREPIRIEFGNGSAIKSIKSEDNICGKRAKYFNKVNEYIANLPDKEFDDLLIECGIEKCPYDNVSNVTIQIILEKLINGEITSQQAEVKIKELIIQKINTIQSLELVFGKSEDYLDGMFKCKNIIKEM